MSKSTPGPWTAIAIELSGLRVWKVYRDTPDGEAVCQLFDKNGQPFLADEPHASLIATAPAMLAALLRADKLLEHTDTWARGETHEIVRSVIAKATGAA